MLGSLASAELEGRCLESLCFHRTAGENSAAEAALRRTVEVAEGQGVCSACRTLGSNAKTNKNKNKAGMR